MHLLQKGLGRSAAVVSWLLFLTAALPPLGTCRSDSPAITATHRVVFQAAAGDWQPLLLLVMQEWEASPFHPG